MDTQMLSNPQDFTESVPDQTTQWRCANPKDVVYLGRNVRTGSAISSRRKLGCNALWFGKRPCFPASDTYIQSTNARTQSDASAGLTIPIFPSKYHIPAPAQGGWAPSHCCSVSSANDVHEYRWESLLPCRPWRTVYTDCGYCGIYGANPRISYTERCSANGRHQGMLLNLVCWAGA